MKFHDRRVSIGFSFKRAVPAVAIAMLDPNIGDRPFVSYVATPKSKNALLSSHKPISERVRIAALWVSEIVQNIKPKPSRITICEPFETTRSKASLKVAYALLGIVSYHAFLYQIPLAFMTKGKYNNALKHLSYEYGVRAAMHLNITLEDAVAMTVYQHFEASHREVRGAMSSAIITAVSAFIKTTGV